ncbi:MAG: TM2 domain-containing protein [Flavobacterium sp.]
MTTSNPREDWNQPQQPYQQYQENKKILAGVLALLIGGIGVHKFILGYTREGIIQIILSIVTCGIAGIIPFIEGIIYLTKTDQEFYQTYQVNKRPWF